MTLSTVSLPNVNVGKHQYLQISSCTPIMTREEFGGDAAQAT
jgi:hypothetical protein